MFGDDRIEKMIYQCGKLDRRGGLRFFLPIFRRGGGVNTPVSRPWRVRSPGYSCSSFWGIPLSDDDLHGLLSVVRVLCPETKYVPSIANAVTNESLAALLSILVFFSYLGFFPPNPTSTYAL